MVKYYPAILSLSPSMLKAWIWFLPTNMIFTQMIQKLLYNLYLSRIDTPELTWSVKTVVLCFWRWFQIVPALFLFIPLCRQQTPNTHSPGLLHISCWSAITPHRYSNPPTTTGCSSFHHPAHTPAPSSIPTDILMSAALESAPVKSAKVCLAKIWLALLQYNIILRSLFRHCSLGASMSGLKACVCLNPGTGCGTEADKDL